MSKKEQLAFSKKLINDIRILLWIVTIGSILLAFYSIYTGSTNSLPWIVSLVSLPWGAHGVVCTAYMNKSKKENTVGGIVYEKAVQQNWESPEV